MENNTYMIIDGEGLLHQSFHKFEKLKSLKGEPTGAIFGFFRTLSLYIHRFEPKDIIITFDNGHSPLRTKLLPTYKAHRKNISIDYESLHKQKKVIMNLLVYIGIKYVFDKSNKYGYEGDDYIAYIALKYWAKKKILIITSDKDFNQLICPRIKIYNDRKDLLVYNTSCKATFGYTPRECVDYLSLVGDTSDDIPGYPGIGEKKARSFLDKYGSIKKYLAQNECLRNDPEHKTMKEVYHRNKRMINLKWYIKHVPIKNLPLYKNETLMWKEVQEISDHYSIGSFNNIIFKKRYEQQFNRTYGKH